MANTPASVNRNNRPAWAKKFIKNRPMEAAMAAGIEKINMALYIPPFVATAKPR